MTNKLRWWIIGAAFAVIVGAMALSEPAAALGCWPRPLGRGGLFAARRPCPPLLVEASVPVRPKEAVKDEPLPAVDKDLRVNVKNLAALLKKGNTTGATKFARGVAPTIDEFADLEHLYRSRKKGGLSLETVITKLNPAAPDNEEAGYLIAAMAELTIAKTPPQGKTRKLWIDAATTLRAAGIDLAQGSALRDAGRMTAAAARINAACNACHQTFK